MEDFAGGSQGGQGSNIEINNTAHEGQWGVGGATRRDNPRRDHRHNTGNNHYHSRGRNENAARTAYSSRQAWNPSRQLQSPALDSSINSVPPHSHLNNLQPRRGNNSRSTPRRRRHTNGERPYPSGGHQRFFVPGRVFRRPTPTMAAPGFNPATNRDTRFNFTQFGYVFTEPVYFIVYAANDLSCLCLAFHTYNDQGLGKPDMSIAAAQRHAVVYSSGQPIPEETKTTREPIAVTMNRPQDTLNEKSRLDLRKIYTIEMNQPVTNIGEVAPWSLGIFFDYVEETLRNQINHIREQRNHVAVGPTYQ